MPRIIRTLLILVLIPALLVWLLFGLPHAVKGEDAEKNAGGAPVSGDAEPAVRDGARPDLDEGADHASG